MRDAMRWVPAILTVMVWAGTAAADVVVEPGVGVEPYPPAFERFSLIYSPEVAEPSPHMKALWSELAA